MKRAVPRPLAIETIRQILEEHGVSDVENDPLTFAQWEAINAQIRDELRPFDPIKDMQGAVIELAMRQSKNREATARELSDRWAGTPYELDAEAIKKRWQRAVAKKKGQK